MLTDLDLDARLHKAITALGYTEATEVQAASIPKALAGADLMVSAKTGSGKTAAFLLPLMHRMLLDDAKDSATRGLILLPTRELALQTIRMFEELAKFTHLKAGLIIGGEAFKFQKAMLRKNPEVVIATPGRLVEHIENCTTDFRDLEVMILDEADRMLDMGFSEDMNTIAKVCNVKRQNLLFSATLHHKGMSKIKGILNEPISIAVDSHRQAHSEIVQQRVLADDNKHKERLVAALVNEEDAKRVFVFCKTRDQCEELGKALRSQNHGADYIHGEIPQSQRKQVMSRFRDGKLRILVATDVAARGLDVSDVDLVINFSIAHSGNDHVHRVGRTGRAGQAGKAISLVNRDEWNMMSSIERYLKIRFEPRYVKGLKATYVGPKNLKKSGKAVGNKKKKKPGGKSTARRPKKPSAASSSRDGFAPLRKKPKL